ncbi:hypothetical protein Tco_0556907 [Tanacetum coccineum]
MMLKSIENGPLVYPTIEENGVIRPKKYAELIEQEQLQDDCNAQATNIVLQGLPPNVYSLVNHCQAPKISGIESRESLHDYCLRFSQLINDMHTIGMTMQQVQVNTNFLNALQPKWRKFVTHVKLAKNIYTTNYDQLYAYLSQYEGHANEARMLCERYPYPLTLVANHQTQSHSVQYPQQLSSTPPLAYSSQLYLPTYDGQRFAGTGTKGNATSSRGNNVVGQARIVKCYNCPGEGHMARSALSLRGQGILHGSRKRYCDDISSAKAVLMANLSSYGSDVFSEVTQHDTYQNNDMLNQSVQEMQSFEQSLIDYVPDNEITKNKHVNESLTNELERYKERVKTFEQRLNVSLSSREKLIDSQMDDMIRNKNALKQEIDLLKHTFSKQIKEKELLLQTFTVLKKESKEKENKYLNMEIDLEKKIKELDNIVYKVGQSAQTVHMLTKPQVFYDDTYKQALGYQNPFYLKKAQRIKLTLYNGSVISKKYDKLSAKQAFWLQISNPISEQPVVQTTPVRTEAPSELPKVSMVKTSFQKLKNHLASFEKVVKVRTTPDAITKGLCGFEHTKAVFKEEVIPFIKTLWELFNDFDNGLNLELNEVKTVFNQIEAAIEQCSVDKKYFHIQKKEIFLDNDRLLEYITCQDVMNIVMHANSVLFNVLSANNKCLVNDNLESERLIQENNHLFELLLSQDIVHICVNSLATLTNYAKMEQDYIDEYSKNLVLKAEPVKKEHD